jgi:hypothetical protein
MFCKLEVTCALTRKDSFREALPTATATPRMLACLESDTSAIGSCIGFG